MVQRFVGSEPATDGFAITKSDSADLVKPIRALRVGGAGNVAFITLDGTTRSFPNALAGEIIFCGMTKVLSTGTSATDLFGYA